MELSVQPKSRNLESASSVIGREAYMSQGGTYRRARSLYISVESALKCCSDWGQVLDSRFRV